MELKILNVDGGVARRVFRIYLSSNDKRRLFINKRGQKEMLTSSSDSKILQQLNNAHSFDYWNSYLMIRN